MRVVSDCCLVGIKHPPFFFLFFLFHPTIYRRSKGEGKGNGPLMALSVLNIGLSGLMATLGVFTIIAVHNAGVKDLSEPFLAFYMILFATLLTLYEVMWWMPVPTLNKSIRKNFGFLYGLKGKGFYLIFVACLCLGLGMDASVKWLNLATGISFLAAGCLHIFIVCAKPELAMKYYAPTAGITSEDEGNNVV